jgi:hypothetical protein
MLGVPRDGDAMRVQIESVLRQQPDLEARAIEMAEQRQGHEGLGAGRGVVAEDAQADAAAGGAGREARVQIEAAPHQETARDFGALGEKGPQVGLGEIGGDEQAFGHEGDHRRVARVAPRGGQDPVGDLLQEPRIGLRVAVLQEDARPDDGGTQQREAQIAQRRVVQGHADAERRLVQQPHHEAGKRGRRRAMRRQDARARGALGLRVKHRRPRLQQADIGREDRCRGEGRDVASPGQDRRGDGRLRVFHLSLRSSPALAGASTMAAVRGPVDAAGARGPRLTNRAGTGCAARARPGSSGKTGSPASP